MKATASPFRSNFYMWNGVSAIFFSNCVTSIHSHNTLQVILDIHDYFRCRIADSPWKKHKNLIIKDNVRHQLDTAGSVQLIIYLDVMTVMSREISARYLDGKDAAEPECNVWDDIKPDELQQTLLRSDPSLLLIIIGKILHRLAGHAPMLRTDDRIYLVLQLLFSTPPADILIDDLARQAHLSISRLRALFKQHTGVPLYKYILWSRIRFAINLLMAGSPVNEAAWSAGFTDNSHFHKILVSMFGISPSQFLRDHQTMDILTCDSPPLSFKTNVFDSNGNLEKGHQAASVTFPHEP